MNRRPAATLVEVLVAIFVMAIGLMALLALFPLGALSMGRAIKDDRTAGAAANATAMAIAQTVHRDNSLIAAFTNPDATVYNDAPPTGPSYPVYVDPVGRLSYLAPANNYVAGQSPGIARRGVSYATTAQQTLQWFTLLDDIVFDVNGTPSTSGGSVEREGIYSWAYLLRRPLASVASEVELTVVVYNNRALQMTPTLQSDETAYNGTFDPVNKASNVVTLTTPGQHTFRAGGWVLDATAGSIVNQKATPGHGTFYRIVNVTDVDATTVELELQSQVLGFPNNAASNCTFIALEGVAEVFPKGTGWRP
jgi:hypothetical protein